MLVGSLLIILAIFGIAWIALAMNRNHELAGLKALLPGAEILNDDNLIEEPSLVRIDVLRIWVYSIDSNQQSQFLASCHSLQSLFPKSDINGPLGCVAAYYDDPSEFRTITLKIQPGRAVISAFYLSSSEYAITTR